MSDETTALETDDWSDDRITTADIEGDEVMADPPKVLYPDETPDEPEPEPEKKPEPQAKAEPVDDDTDVLWSSEDLQTATVINAEATRFNQDLAQFQQLKQAGVEKLSGGDKAKEAAIRNELAAIEQDLIQRKSQLQDAVNQMATTAQQRQETRAQRKLQSQKARLNERVPDLDSAALKSYLKAQGFSDEDIRTASDARIVEAFEKARRYDAQQKAKPPKRVRVPTKERRVPPAVKGESTEQMKWRLGMRDDPAFILYGDPNK